MDWHGLGWGTMERQDCLMSICFIICSAVPLYAVLFLIDVGLLSLYVLFIMLYTVLLSLYAVRLSLDAVVWCLCHYM